MSSDSWISNAAVAGLLVSDLNGHALGRAASVDPAARHLVVQLAPRVAHRLHADAVLLDVSFADIVNIDDHEVTLAEVGEYLVHPERKPHESIEEG